MNSNQAQKWIPILIVALCTLIIVLNHFYRWPLYYRGIDWILWAQAHSFWLLDWFFLTITMVIDPSIVFVGVILMMVMSHRKRKAFIMLMFVLINIYLAALLKAYDCDPRPIWTSDEIRNIGFYCPVQYGNPSGHSWFSALIGFGVFLQYFGAGQKLFNIWLALAFCIFVPLSRMYLGAHSLNQVLEGLTLGLALCILFIFTLRTQIQKYLLYFNDNRFWRALIIGCHISYLIPYLVNANEQLPDAWEANIMNKCRKQMDEIKLNYLMLVANALFVNVATGIGFGYSALAGHPLGKNYLQGKWEINEHRHSWMKGYFLYVLTEILCLLSGLIAAGFIIYLKPTRLVGFMALSLGGIASGYIYASKTIRILNQYKIIRSTGQTES